ncbi:MAG TPA: DoxX family protein, partial [Thermoanaerobaculia bacterium]
MEFPSSSTSSRGLRIGLWSAQIALAIVFALAGWMKVSTPAAALTKMMPGFPLAFLRFIGIAELTGSIGIILPALTRIAPKLTPLAASGFVIVMASAAVFHLAHGQFGELAVVVVLGALAYFVAWGRFKLAPIARRERHDVTGLPLDEGRQ